MKHCVHVRVLVNQQRRTVDKGWKAWQWEFSLHLIRRHYLRLDPTVL